MTMLHDAAALLPPVRRLRSARDALLTERDSLLGARAGLLAERDAWLAERAGLQQEREALLGERVVLQAERETLHAERARLQQEHEALLGERVVLQAERQTLHAERAKLQQEHEALLGERAALRAERQTLHAERALLRAECRRLAAASPQGGSPSFVDHASLDPEAERRSLHAERVLRAECRRLAARSPEAGSPFFHYHASFDPQAVMRHHAAAGLQPYPSYLTNFLGVRIDPKFFPDLLDGRAGEVEGVPIPANWHSDIAEWGAALRAVDLAGARFTAIELGCGWGCWINNTGVAARRSGREVHLIGVEGDAGHLGFAREACAANGFAPEQVTLLHGIAAPAAGVALFPRQAQAGVQWGLEPVFGATEAQITEAVASGGYEALPMLALGDIAAAHARIDLLHIDIQGGEAAFIAGCLPVMHEKVAYLLVGTHSRQLDGQVMELMLAAGWRLEIERPAMFTLLDGRPLIWVDGVQGWRNPALERPARTPD
jgi:hypothetical protein